MLWETAKIVEENNCNRKIKGNYSRNYNSWQSARNSITLESLRQFWSFCSSFYSFLDGFVSVFRWLDFGVLVVSFRCFRFWYMLFLSTGSSRRASNECWCTCQYKLHLGRGEWSAGKGWGFDSKIYLLSGSFYWVPFTRGSGHLICVYCYFM